MAGRRPVRLIPDDGVWDDSLLLDAYVASMASLRVGELEEADEVGDSRGGGGSVDGVGGGSDKEAGGSVQETSGSVQEDCGDVHEVGGNNEEVSTNVHGGNGMVNGEVAGGGGYEAGDEGEEDPDGGGSVRDRGSGNVFEASGDCVPAAGLESSPSPEVGATVANVGALPLSSVSSLTAGRQQRSASFSSVDGRSTALAPRGSPIAEETSPAQDDSDFEASPPTEAEAAPGGEATTGVADGWRVTGSPATIGLAATPNGPNLFPTDGRSVGDIEGSPTWRSLHLRPSRDSPRPPRPPRGHTLRPNAAVPALPLVDAASEVAAAGPLPPRGSPLPAAPGQPPNPPLPAYAFDGSWRPRGSAAPPAHTRGGVGPRHTPHHPPVGHRLRADDHPSANHDPPTGHHTPTSHHAPANHHSPAGCPSPADRHSTASPHDRPRLERTNLTSFHHHQSPPSHHRPVPPPGDTRDDSHDHFTPHPSVEGVAFPPLLVVPPVPADLLVPPPHYARGRPPPPHASEAAAPARPPPAHATVSAAPPPRPLVPPPPPPPPPGLPPGVADLLTAWYTAGVAAGRYAAEREGDCTCGRY